MLPEVEADTEEERSLVILIIVFSTVYYFTFHLLLHYITLTLSSIFLIL